MTFFNDLWKKFKTTGPLIDTAQSTAESNILEKEKAPLKFTSNHLEEVLQAFEQNEIENLQKEAVMANLKALKALVDQPKEEKPELRFSKIKQHLGAPECHETVRQERWQEQIHCPKCKSTQIKRIMPPPQQNPLNHRYRCLNCQHIFSDSSDTPLEKNLPPLNIWMQCWYLMGCTESLGYIASKLGLDLAMVEYMVGQLQKIFNAQKPLTRLGNYEEWSKQSQHLRDQLNEDLLKQYERLNANIATAPKDTTEFRRQQNLRRDLTSTTAPPSPGGKKR